MNASSTAAHRLELGRALDPGASLISPAGATGFLWLVSSNTVSTLAVLCSYVMLQLVWVSYLLWLKHRPSGLPVFAIMGAIYWIYFALPLYIGGRVLTGNRAIPIPEEFV